MDGECLGGFFGVVSSYFIFCLKPGKLMCIYKALVYSDSVGRKVGAHRVRGGEDYVGP